MKFGRGYKHMQETRRFFAFFPVRDSNGYWLWLEVLIYDPKTGKIRRVD